MIAFIGFCSAAILHIRHSPFAINVKVYWNCRDFTLLLIEDTIELIFFYLIEQSIGYNRGDCCFVESWPINSSIHSSLLINWLLYFQQCHRNDYFSQWNCMKSRSVNTCARNECKNRVKLLLYGGLSSPTTLIIL